jgi:integrase/recombinase XerD
MRFEEFLKEREYLLGVSRKTLTYYRTAFASWTKRATDGKPVTWIQSMKQAGISNISINTYICAMNAYWKWSGEGEKLKYLKEEETILITFTREQVTRIVNGKAVGRNETRARMAALTALDTGMRIQELLNLRRADVDFDNLCFRVHGKGNKHRLVPMSIELRKLLFRHLSQHKFERVFCTGGGTEPTQRNLSRDFKLLCGRIGVTGVRVAFHNLRHTFAVEYLRKGGNVLYLQRILGHTSLEMTNRYVRSLGIEDLKAVHSVLSLLSR